MTWTYHYRCGGVQRSWLDLSWRRKNTTKTKRTKFLSVPSVLRHACTTSLQFILGSCYVFTTSMSSFFLRPVSTTSAIFEHVQSSATSFTSTKTISRPYRLSLPLYYVVQVLNTPAKFLETYWERSQMWRGFASLGTSTGCFSNIIFALTPWFSLESLSKDWLQTPELK